MSDAIVVGAGPNGLAAAVALAQRGLKVTVLEAADEIGGGTRTSELTVPGLLHDHCSAVHPLGVGSPFLRTLGLERYGVAWEWPDVDLAHPLDGGRAGVLVRSMERTVRGLGPDGPAWERLFAPLAEDFDALTEDLLRPVPHLPAHPVELARFGLRALQPATTVARRWRGAEARALFAGAAAHLMYPLTGPASSAVGLMLVGAAHRFGWPVARGGSRTITDALAALLAQLGGTIETGVRVDSLDQLAAARIVMLDTAPGAAARICGDRLPGRVRSAYEGWRHGPAAFKVDLAVQDGIPWTHEACRRAGTVHLGGTLEEVVRTEAQTAGGRMPERPFVLVGQQYLADPSRSRGDVHPIWAYAHVPHGYPGDATEAVLRQIERFAPGFRERIVGLAARSTAELARSNTNFVGGDIVGGANTARQVALRPRVALDPYSTGIPGVYLCSAATPPGAGVHGMCGANAARSALRYLAR
ncbi:phytoene desaturase family protein [Streptomyces avermitilis]|uniref:phytoene desaturase family protein n=1 Tax=Streptomyces avermitilis TaxID=33903 RepID=UPI0036CAB6A4